MIFLNYWVLTCCVTATVYPLAAQSNQSAPTSSAVPSAAASNTQLTQSVDDLVEAARAASRADQNYASTALFAQAINQAPERRREWLQEYADQLLYSNQSTQAIPLYQEVLDAPRSQDEKRRSLNGLGNAYLWTDRPSQAREFFEALLREDPNNQEVQRSLGRALSWSGRQREAITHLQQYLRDHPEDQEARVQLAQSQAWMGRQDFAAKTLEDISADRADARKLHAELERAIAPRTVVDARQSSQSDQVNIRSLRLGHWLNFSNARGAVGLQLEQTEYEREDHSDSIQVSRPTLNGRYRLSDGFEINTEIGRERIRPRGSAVQEASVYSSWLTWWPSDIVRFDLSSSRSSFDNLQSLRLGVTANQNALSIDFTPSERQRYNAKIESANYSDGNVRLGNQLQAEYRFFSRPEVWVGVKHTRFAFDQQTNNGYFNPLSFHATQLTLRSNWHPDGPDGRWDLASNLAIGSEHVQPDGNKPTSDLSLRAAYKLDAETRLELRLQRFSSRTQTLGFSRRALELTLARTW